MNSILNRCGKCFGSVIARVATNQFDKLDIYEAIVEDYREAVIYIDRNKIFDVIVCWIGLDKDEDYCYIAYNLDELEFLEETEGLIKLRKEITIKNVIQ
jgi:hypothetical protein